MTDEIKPGEYRVWDPDCQNEEDADVVTDCANAEEAAKEFMEDYDLDRPEEVGLLVRDSSNKLQCITVRTVVTITFVVTKSEVVDETEEVSCPTTP
jgi:hypothetical protein